MRNNQMSLGLFITSIILLSDLKNNTGQQNIPLTNRDSKISHNVSFTEPVKVNIGDVIAVKGKEGQRTVDVTVFLSQATSNKVTMKYNTRNGKAIAGVDYVAKSGSISFEPGEIVKRISISIIGEVAAEPDSDANIVTEVGFEINLNSLVGAILEKGTAIINIIRDISRDPRFNTGNKSVYDVTFTFTGYTSLGGDILDCPIRSNGTVVLTGLLAGSEKVADHDDVSYTGTLQLEIDMDICSAKTEEEASGGYPVCGITVTGSGPVLVELDIYFGGRGGYIKIEDKSGTFQKSVGGSCDPGQINEERSMVPDKTIAAIFNGRDLPMLTDRTLTEGIYEEVDGKIKTKVKVTKVK